MARNGNAKTRRFALNMLKAGVAIFGAALLFACGDDDSSFGTSAKGGSAAEADIVVTIFDDLPSCVGKREGVTAYVKDEKIAYICTDGDWVADSETGDDSDGDDDGEKSSSSKAVSTDSKGKSSGSEGVGDASSSSVIASSSSEELVCSCNFNKSSSSSRGLFEMSKDEFLNPKITYGTMTDTRDNKTYKTVKIGTQVWMAENLNYAYTGFEYDYSGYTSDSTSWCYSNDASNCEIYGRLYTWAAAMDSAGLVDPAGAGVGCGYGERCGVSGSVRGICPEGWHLPDTTEWNALFDAVGGKNVAGKMLKSAIGWNDFEGSNGNGLDAYGFSALPAGRLSNGRFEEAGYGANFCAGYDAYFWSASQYGDGHLGAYELYLAYGFEDADLGVSRNSDGRSVRCLQN